MTGASSSQAQAQFDTNSLTLLFFGLACFLASLTVIHLLDLLSAWSRRSRRREEDTNEKAIMFQELPNIGRGANPLRQLPSALLTTFRICAFRWTIPLGNGSVMLLSEAVVIAGYVAFLTFLTITNTENYKLAFINKRAALLGASQFPIVIALAGKNNLISYLTGVSHERLNIIHRYAARTVFTMAWVHGAAGLLERVSLKEPSNMAGFIALSAFTLLVLLSLRPIRSIAYEFFLLTHLFLIFLIIGASWYHKPAYAYFYWPSILVLALDKLIRVFRLLYHNTTTRNPAFGDALVEYLSPTTVRLTLRRPMWWLPGQHAYVTLPSISNLPLEAHPFTIASVPEAGKSEQKLVMIIRGQKGFTKKLVNYASGKRYGYVRALIDGPYGCPPDLRTFSTCVLIAGGSGVTYCFAQLLELIRNAHYGTAAVRKIVFVWSIRDSDHLKWILQPLKDALRAAPSSVVIQPLIFVTGWTPGKMSTLTFDIGQDDGPASVRSKKMQFDYSHSTILKMAPGRPNINRILNQEIENTEGPISVDVAGPSGLAKSVRSALRSGVAGPSSVLQGKHPVSLHIETFGMSSS